MLLFSAMERASRTLWSAAALAVLAGGGAGLSFAAVGCSKVSEAAPSAESVAETPAAVGPAAASFDNANYRAAIRSGGPCKKDQTCVAEVVVEPKGEYHINDKYPYRFKLNEPPPGLKYPKPVVGKEDGTIEERKAVLKVPFVPENAGEKKVSGVLSLSVCSAANCLMDKQALELSVKVD
jgi:hypothetical protein